MTDDAMLTVRDVAKRLALSERTVHRLASTGELPALRFGRAVRFDPRDIEAFVEQHRIQQEKP